MARNIVYKISQAAILFNDFDGNTSVIRNLLFKRIELNICKSWQYNTQESIVSC